MFLRAFTATALGLSGCSGISTSTDFDPQTDFSRVRTWDWFPAAKTADDSVMSLMNVRIERAVEDTLVSKGLSRAQTPDVHVAYRAWVAKRFDTVPASGASASYAYGWRRTFVVNGGTEVREYDEGTLVLDVIDPATKTLLWRGTAKSAADASASPETRDAKIREAVARLLESFPPRR